LAFLKFPEDPPCPCEGVPLSHRASHDVASIAALRCDVAANPLGRFWRTDKGG
jgi:hypothetical protein